MYLIQGSKEVFKIVRWVAGVHFMHNLTYLQFMYVVEVLVSTEIKFDISLVLKKSCLRQLATSPRKLLYYLAAIRSRIDADKARPVDKQLVTDLRKTSF